MMDIQWSLTHPTLVVGILTARSVSVGPADAKLSARLDAVVAQRAADGIPPAVRAAIRNVLRLEGYKPTGRGKPANEYLLRAAQRGEFPRINNLVDINNLMSLQTGWPASILDAQRALAGTEALEIRNGGPDERTVFNASGQEMLLTGLPGLAAANGVMIGNAVKDSMAGKTVDETTEIVAVFWASLETHTATEVARALKDTATLLREHAGAEEIEAMVMAQGQRHVVVFEE